MDIVYKLANDSVAKLEGFLESGENSKELTMEILKANNYISIMQLSGDPRAIKVRDRKLEYHLNDDKKIKAKK